MYSMPEPQVYNPACGQVSGDCFVQMPEPRPAPLFPTTNAPTAAEYLSPQWQPPTAGAQPPARRSRETFSSEDTYVTPPASFPSTKSNASDGLEDFTPMHKQSAPPVVCSRGVPKAQTHNRGNNGGRGGHSNRGRDGYSHPSSHDYQNVQKGCSCIIS